MPSLKYAVPALVSLVVLVAGQSQLAIAEDAATIEKGKQLYNQNCSVCHQADAIGKPGFAPSLTNKELLSISSDKFLLGTIRDGRAGTGMPPF
ncbi:MAG: c-type cytochrome, partial [Acidiferrobacterales bacterium]